MKTNLKPPIKPIKKDVQAHKSLNTPNLIVPAKLDGRPVTTKKQLMRPRKQKDEILFHLWLVTVHFYLALYHIPYNFCKFAKNIYAIHRERIIEIGILLIYYGLKNHK